ncbi:MAG: hypothetical protein ABI833_23020, partial [Acidobacteriota bacterium]
MKFFSENHSGHVNIDSGTSQLFHPFQPGIHIHIPPESVFTSLRNNYPHAPESALLDTTAAVRMRMDSMRVNSLWRLLTLLAVLAAPLCQAYNRPDFSGIWNERPEGGISPEWGAIFTIDHQEPR